MATKLLLIEDVLHLGKSGDLVSVKAGFARNYLVPQGLAVPANKGTERMRERLQSKRLEQAAVDLKASQEIAHKLEGLVITIEVKVDPDGNMYGSVSEQELLRKIYETTGVELSKQNIHLKHPIKETGVKTVTILLKEGVKADIQVKVLPEA